MASGTKLLESQLSEYEHKARAVCIGVNHLALDTERIQQDELLQKVKKLEQELKDSASQKSGLPQRASELRSDIKSNSAALRYLETISRLERSFTVLTENVSETSVQLSSPKALTESVYVKKDLGGNVQSCWNYVSNLSRLSQVHIRNAAEYQQFHHAVNEVEAKLSRRIKMTHPDHARPLDEDITGAHVLANELRDHLNHFIHLWNRTGQLLEESRRVVPVHLRLGGVNNGLSTNTEVPSVVMARALLSLAGPNYELAEGEEVRIVSNTDDPHFWKVQTSSGIVEVPSVCLWISDPDLGAVKRAITAREKCVESWELAVDRMRERLRTYYTRMLSHMAENGDVYYSSKNVMQHFLDDLDLLYPPSDASAVELKRALNRFQDKLQLVERGRQPRDAFVLREQDIVSMHSPLLRLRDHENQMRSLNVQAQFIGQHMAHYLREIDADRRRMDDELKRMTSLQRDHQTQLEHLISRVRRWSSRYDRGHPKFDSQESGTSSSVRSSTRSDVTWHGEAASRVRRDVMDAITQIGVETENAASQTHPLEMTTEVTEYRTARPLKESICQIGQITSVQLIQTEGLQAPPPLQKRDLFQAITQTGTVHADASLQTDVLETSWVGVEQARTQQALPTQVGDAVCQVGYIQSTSHTQTEEPWLGTAVSRARDQQAVGLQTSAAQPARDAICQIGTVTSSASIQTAGLALKPTRSVSEQFVASSMQPRPVSDVICQIGSLLAVQGTQTPHVETSRFHAITQTGMITTESEVQADLFLARPRQESTLAAACQVGVLQQPAAVQVSLLTPRPTVLDAICQIGLLQQSVATQVEPPTGRHFDVATQLGVLSMEQQLQTEMLEEIPMVEVIQQQQQRVFTTTANVETQVGVLSYNQATQFAGPVGKPSTSMACQTELGPVKDTTVQHLGKFYVDSYNVESQTGVITNNWATQTEDRMIETKIMPVVSAPAPKAYAYVAQTSEQRRPKLHEFALQTPQELKPKPRSKSYDVLTQVGIAKESRSTQVERSHKDYDVGSQVGVISQSKSIQTTQYTAVAPDTFEVELQTGVVTMSRDTQTRIDYQKRVQVEDANVGTDIRERGRDATIATADQLVMEPVLVQQAFRPATPKEEFGQQVEILSTRFDVETQSGVVTQADSTQTTTMEESVAKVSTAKYDVEMQSGVITQAHGTQTEMKFSAAIPVDDASVQHARPQPAENKKFQVTINPLAYDAIIESEKPILVDTVTPVKQIIPDVPKSEAGIQTITQSRYDVELQSGIVSHPHSTQTDMRLKPAISTSDVSIQYGKSPPVGYDRLLETEPQLHVDVVAPIQQVREVIQTDDFCAQATLAPSRYDVEMQSGTVTDVHGTQTEMKVQSVVPVDDASVQHATPKPKPGENKKFQVNIGPAAFDTLLESEQPLRVDVIAPVQQVIPEVRTSEAGIQASHAPSKYDVELQSGTVTDVHSTQTELKLTPVRPVNDASMQFEGKRPLAYDRLLESEKPLHVDVIAPVEQVRPQTPKDDFGVQADIVPNRYDVELQSGVVTDTHGTQADTKPKPVVQVNDASVQHEFKRPPAYDRLLEADQPVRVDVVAPVQQLLPVTPKDDVGVQVAIVPNKFDVEIQSGVVTETHGNQTDVKPKPIVPVNDISVQHVLARPSGYDRLLETEPQLHVDVVAPIQQVREVIQTDDFCAQATLAPSRYDVEMQSGTVTDVHGTQTEMKVQSVVPVDDASVQHATPKPKPGENKKFQVNIGPAAFDTLLESEQPLRVDVIAPVQQTIPEVPKSDIGTQVHISPERFDVELQSGIVSTIHAVQTEPQLKPVVPVDDSSVQHVCEKPKPVDNKLLQVQIGSMGYDKKVETERIDMVDVVAPVVPIKYDVEIQSGVATDSHSIQTDLRLKLDVPVSDASVQHEERKPAGYDTILETEKPLSLEVIAPVQQLRSEPSTNDFGTQVAILPNKFDVELQSGIVIDVHGTQTEIVPVDEVSVQHEAIRRHPGENKKFQVNLAPAAVDAILESEPQLLVDIIAPVQQVHPETPKHVEIQVGSTPVTYDVELQSGIITEAHSVQTDEIRKSPIHTVDAGVQHVPAQPTPGENKKFQVNLSPSAFDTLVEAKQPQQQTVLKNAVGLQAEVVHMTTDVQVQSGVITSVAGVQTDVVDKPRILTEDVSVQFTEKRPIGKENQTSVKPTTRDETTQSEDPLHIDVVAPVKREVIPTENMGVQAVIQPTRCDVEMQSGTVMSVHETQTEPLLKPVTPVDDVSVQYEAARPTARDMIVESEKPLSVEVIAPVQQVMPKTPQVDMGIQATIVPTRYDVEMQSGVVTDVHGIQTDKVLKPVVPVDDVGVQYEAARPTARDMIVESEKPLSVEVIAPVQQVMPKTPQVDMVIQATIVPTRYDVEMQSGTVMSVHETQTEPLLKPVTLVDDVSVQYEAARPTARDMIVESEKPLSVEVIAPVQQVMPKTPQVDMGIQATIVPTRYDVEMQSGVVTDVHGIQTDKVLKPVVPVDDASIQYEQDIGPVGKNKKLQVALHPIPHDRMLDSGEPISVDIIAPVQVAAIPMAEASLQAVITPTTYDVECQLGVTTKSGSTQTDAQEKTDTLDVSIQYKYVPEVQTSQKEVQAELKKKFIDIVIGTGPESRQQWKDYQSKTEEELNVQVLAPVQAAIPGEDVGIQAEYSPITYDVELQSGVLTMIQDTQTDPLTKLVVPTDDAGVQFTQAPPKPGSNKKFQVMLTPAGHDTVMSGDLKTQPDVVAPPMYDVELQSGVVTAVRQTQTDIQTLQPSVPVDEVNVHYERAMPVSHDLVLESERPFVAEVVAPVQQVIPGIETKETGMQTALTPTRYDVELQSGTVTTVHSSQTEAFVRPVVPVEDVSVQLEQAVGPAGKNKKFQVAIQAVPYDRSVDSGEPIRLDAIAPVQRMLAQVEDASVQASITPKLSDVSLQCGTVTNTCGLQTDEMEKPLVSVEESAVEYRISSPPTGVNKKLQFSAYSEPQDICVGSDIPIQTDVNAPVKQLPQSVATDSFGVQVVISADLYDVETQAGHVTNAGSTQTEAITIPMVDEADVQYQAFTITSGLNKKLQVRVSPIQVEASVQKDGSPVGATRSFGAQTAEDLVDSKVTFVRRAAGQDYTTNTEDILTVVALPMEQTVRIEPEKSDVSTQCGIRTETSVTQTSVLSTRTRSVATDEPLSIEVVAPVQTVSQEDKTRKYDVSVQLGVKTQVALTQTEPELGRQQKVTSTQTEPLAPDAIECAVTTVAYHETEGSSRNKKLQVSTDIPQLDFSTQTEPREPILSDMQTQTIVRDEEMTQTTVSYMDSVRKESQGFRPHPAIPLVESITEFATPHRNKKCQINLVSSEGTKPMTSNKKLQARVIQLDSECQFESRPVVSETTQPVPAVRVEAEAQAGPIQHNKKLQASVVSSTDSVAFVPASKSDASTMTLPQPSFDVWTQIEEPVRMEPEVRELQLAGQFATPLDRRDCAMQTTLSLTSDAMVDTIPTKYVTQIIQAEAEPTQESSIFRTQLITSFSEKVEAEPTKAEVTHVSFSQRPPQPIELTPKVEHTAYVSKTIQLSVPRADNSLQTDLMTASKHSPVQTRHVRIQKGSSWLFSRQQDTGIQVDLTEVGQESPLYVRPVQTAARSEVVDTTECYVSSRYGSMTSPTGSARGSVLGGRYMRPNVVSWGVQCTPHTLTGVTQTTDLLKYETGSEISGDAVSIKEDVKQSKGVATIGVQTDIEDEYLIKRVVTTVARRSAIQSYRHNAPVLKQLRGRGRTPLLSSSLPSNLDGQFIEDDDEQLAGVPVTTKKVTTTYLDGTQKVVREELLTEEVQSRARSLDSRIATHMHLSEQDMYEADVFDLPDETDLQTDAEHCFNNLLNIWSVPYLLTRIRRRGGSLSVDRDLGTTVGTGRPTRLVGAKTQYTSTGSLLLSQTGNTRTAETQTFGFVGTNRPPHKNKRIQRGPSCISWSPSQTTVAVVEPSPPTDESSPISAPGRQTRSTQQQQQHEQTQQVGFTTTYTEVHREHSSSFASAVEDYVCPKCGTHAHIPQFGTMSTTQSQSLPITQLRNALSQTRSSGYYTLENAGLTLPVYIGDEELMRINPNQEVVEQPQVSVITWCPGDDIERSDAGSPSTTHDEVWVDSPGKLLEMQVTGVTVPGTNKVISAAEAFYRGILRVVYWDYTKVDPRQTSGDMGVAIPLVDAVLSDAVKLAAESRRDKPSRDQTTDDQSTSTLDAHVVWTTPERHRTRYLVHSIRPEVERQEVGSRTVSDAYTVAAAIRAGYIDRDSGLLVVRNPPTTGLSSSTMHQYPYGTEESSPYDEQTETLSVQEAMRRGILQAELIETDSPYQTRSEGQLRTLPLYSPQDMPQDMDI